MPMHGHFYTPCSNWARILPHPFHMTHGPGGCPGPTSQWRLRAGRFGGVDWGVWGLRVRVNRRARSAPLSLSGRAHITAVVMWSCLPHHTLLLPLFLPPFCFLMYNCYSFICYLSHLRGFSSTKLTLGQGNFFVPLVALITLDYMPPRRATSYHGIR